MADQAKDAVSGPIMDRLKEKIAQTLMGSLSAVAFERDSPTEVAAAILALLKEAGALRNDHDAAKA